MQTIAPLKASFFFAGLIGFLVSAFYIAPLSRTWGFTFGFMFTLIFIAAVISMTRGSPDEQLLPRPKRIK